MFDETPAVFGRQRPIQRGDEPGCQRPIEAALAASPTVVPARVTAGRSPDWATAHTPIEQATITAAIAAAWRDVIENVRVCFTTNLSVGPPFIPSHGS
jgi:hypothetical protein